MDPLTKDPTPSLSVVVPATSHRTSAKGTNTQHIWQPVTQTSGRTRSVLPAKQKRLFPIACRVVPLDLWFTTRVDRTWQVQDLKVWLLSKALPDSALTLPPSYRPSSPVTFAAPPPPMPATHSHSSPPHSPQPGSRGGLGSSPPPSPYDYFLDDDDVSVYAPSYYTVDSFEDGRVRPLTPRSIPYSFSTGAPSISGLEALKTSNARTLNRTFPGASDGKDPELWKRATELAAKWTLYSFSTGMQLSDDMAISEYHIRSFELLELHPSNSYIQLPRTLLPSARALSPPLHPPSGPASRAYRGTRFHQLPPPSPPRDFSQDETDSEEDDITSSQTFSGSPYAQSYFECWAWILRNPADLEELQKKAAKRRLARGGELSLVTAIDEGDSLLSPERWRRAWMTVKEGMLRIHKDRSDMTVEAKYEIARCAALHGPEKLEGLSMGSMGIGQKRFLGSLSSSVTKFTICARFRQPPAPVSREKPSRTSNKSKQHQNHNQGVLSSMWLIFKVGDRDTHENLLRILHRLSYSSPVALADSIPPSNRPHSRTSTRTANTSISLTLSSFSLLHQRTLRTDFLPNPIPHPLSLRFSAPSPPGDSSPLSPNFNYSFDLDDETLGGSSVSMGRSRSLNMGRNSEEEGLGRGGGMGMGLGKGMSVRFPEWREEVVRRAIEAGLWWGELELHHDEERRASTPLARTGIGVSATGGPGEIDAEVVHPEGEGEPIYFERYDTDEDDGAGSDTFSELEWDGWAYDLDRPKGTAGLFGGGVAASGRMGGGGGAVKKKGLKTPNASPASATDEDDDERERGWDPIPTATTRMRAKSVIVDSPTGTFSRDSSSATVVASTSTATSPTTPSVPPLPSASTSTRIRASTVSVRSTPPRFTDDPSRYMPVPKTPTGASSSFLQAQISGQGGEASACTSGTGTGTGTGGKKGGIMRGFNMRAGKESFRRGLENALDFVEGK